MKMRSIIFLLILCATPLAITTSEHANTITDVSNNSETTIYYTEKKRSNVPLVKDYHPGTNKSITELRNHLRQRPCEGWCLSDEEKAALDENSDQNQNTKKVEQRKKVNADLTYIEQQDPRFYNKWIKQESACIAKHFPFTSHDTHKQSSQKKLWRFIPSISILSFGISALLWVPGQIYNAYLYLRPNPWIQTGTGTYMHKNHPDAKSLHDAWVKKWAYLKPKL